MSAKDETYNAVTYMGCALEPHQIEQLACAVERAESDPMAYVEVGRIYCALIAGEIERDHVRQNNFLRDVFLLTSSGHDKVKAI